MIQVYVNGAILFQTSPPVREPREILPLAAQALLELYVGEPSRRYGALMGHGPLTIEVRAKA